jgi:hypothetical protein
LIRLHQLRHHPGDKKTAENVPPLYFRLASKSTTAALLTAAFLATILFIPYLVIIFHTLPSRLVHFADAKKLQSSFPARVDMGLTVEG